MSENGRPTYPPPGHIIRHLRMDLELRTETEMLGTMPISDDVCDAGGALKMGALATLIDVAAGTFSHEMVRPDWLATADMKVHLRRPAIGDEVMIRTTTVRAGRRNIVSQTIVNDADGEVARGWVTYTRLPRRDDSPPVEVASRIGRHLVYVEQDEGEHERENLDDYVGIDLDRIVVDTEDQIAFELDHSPRIHNSFGSLQGGAAAVLIERAATLAIEKRFGSPGRVTDLHVYYLGQTRAGPLKVEGSVLRSDPGSLTCDVSILDIGNENQLLDIATATAIPIST